MGNLNLLFSLEIDSKYIKEKNINYEEVKEVKDLQFLLDDKSLWDKIEVSSENGTINMILTSNKINKKKVSIDYIILDKMDCDENQQKFKEFIDYVSDANSIKLHQSEVCECNVAISLNIKCGEDEKNFSLTNSKGLSGPKKEEKNEEEKNEEKKDEEKKDEEKKDENAPEEENNEKEKEAEKPPQEGNEENNNNENEENKNNENNNNNENENEEEDEDENPFTKITEVDVGNYDFVYFDLKDFTESEIANSLKLDDLKGFFIYLKLNTATNIILNVGKGDCDFEELKNILYFPDIYIFGNKDDVYNLMNQFYEKKKKQEKEEKKQKEEEEKKKREEKKKKREKFMGVKNKKKKKKKSKKDEVNYIEDEEVEDKQKPDEKKDEENNEENNEEKKEENKEENNEEENKEENNEENNEENKEENEEKKEEENKDENQEEEDKKEDNKKEDEKKEEDKNKKEKDKKDKKKDKLDKRKVYEIFSSEICQKSPLPFSEKIGIFIDDFKKYLIVKVTKDCERPDITEYDMKCYPKPNPHNMELVEDYKNIIKENYDEYKMIFDCCLLSKLAEAGSSDENIFISYLTGMEVIKKMIELKKNGLEAPKNKNFYQVNISKSTVDKIFGDSAAKKQEGNFVLDCIDKKKSRYKIYNPLLDKNLNPYFSTEINKKFLQNSGFVNDKGFIVYDSVYRDTLGSVPKKKKEDIKPDELMSTINQMQVSKNINNKNKDSQEEAVRKNPTLNTQVAAFKYKQHESNLNQTQKLSSSNKNKTGNLQNKTTTSNMNKSKNENFSKTTK